MLNGCWPHGLSTWNWVRDAIIVRIRDQEKALVGAFSVITNLRMYLFEALLDTRTVRMRSGGRMLVCVCPLSPAGGYLHNLYWNLNDTVLRLKGFSLRKHAPRCCYHQAEWREVVVFKLWSGIWRRESQPDIIARFQIFLQIFLALEHLNGAGGNVWCDTSCTRPSGFQDGWRGITGGSLWGVRCYFCKMKQSWVEFLNIDTLMISDNILRRDRERRPSFSCNSSFVSFLTSRIF